MSDSIRAETIASLIRHVLDPKGRRQITWDAKIGKYIKGGAAGLAGFAAVLNQSQQFQGYGLDLAPTDLSGVKVVRDLVTAVIGWFQGAGWTVTL